MDGIGSNSSQLIVTMFWIMMTGGVIWAIDNVMKGFENVMEDGFKHQARSLNQSFRVNSAILLLCISTFAYFKYYLREDTSALTGSGVIGSVLWLFSTVGKFILYLLTYVVYGLYQLVETSYEMERPPYDEDIFIGFIILLGYILVKRLLITRMNPLVWAIIVVLVAAGSSYLSDRYGINLKDKIKSTIQRDTTEEIIPIAEIEVIDNEKVRPPISDNEDCITTAFSDSVMFIKQEELNSAILEFITEEARLEPNADNYRNNAADYQQAIVDHMEDMKSRASFLAIVKVTNDYKKEGIFKDCRIQTTLQAELCDFYYTYFDRICPKKELSPLAN